MARQEQDVAELAQILHIMGDVNRLRILIALQEGELNVTELCRRLKAPQPTVSRHLGILRMGGLVVNRRRGKEIFYSLARSESGARRANVRRLFKGGPGARLGLLVLRALRR